MTRHLCALAFASAILGTGASASAQTPSTTSSDPGDSARFQWGALRFTPAIAVSNVGVDNNVFNDVVDPKRDTTASVGPAVNLWLKMGKSRLSGKTTGQYVYFHKYEDQRSWTANNEGRWDLPLSRIAPFLVASLSNSRDRAGFEIDSRVHLKTTSYGLGTSVRLSGKTSVVLSGKRSTFTYDDSQTYYGADLAQSLNRRSDAEELQFRTQLTPLTTFVVRSEAVQDRFDSEQARNADSVSVLPGFEFKPQALISGTAFVGIRHFNVLSETLPDFTGVVASVSTNYIVSATQIEVKVARDLNYSYEVLQPYYALTDVGLTVTQRITHVWDIVGRAAWQSLAYRNVNAVARVPQRTDHGRQFGAGVGYRLGETFRLGFDANYYRRQSPTFAFREYEGFRFGGSISYGS